MTEPKHDFVILPYHEIFYLESLRFCAHSALVSVRSLNKHIDTFDTGDQKFDPKAPLDELQNIVNQSGSISRFFWPPDKKYRKRGELLRNTFGLTDGNPIENRELRNLVEHYDEYLDEYLKTVGAGVFFPHYFGPEPEDGGIPRHYFKAYYTDSGVFSVLGRRLEIQPIVDQISQINRKLNDLKTKGRFPSIK